MASPVEPAVVFIDQTGQTIQVQPSQQPIIILNGDNREFSQLPLGNIGNMSIINVNQIQRWNDKPITLTLAEPEPIFTGLIPTISDGLKTDSEDTHEVVQNSPKTSMANIIPGARKSAPGSIAPPQSNADEDLISCFLCPGIGSRIVKKSIPETQSFLIRLHEKNFSILLRFTIYKSRCVKFSLPF